jgi:uncharacterized membrane protein
VNDRDQSDELQQLRAQVAELTRRVYHLEGLLGSRVPTEPREPAETTAGAQNIPAPVSSHPAARSQSISTFLRMPSKPGSSLESKIGGQLLNRIGIIAVLVGLSYFLKLAFENGWIGPATQVLIGIAGGIGLIFWSERFRSKGYGAFAYSLKAIGIGSLYLSLWAASQYYHLVSPTVAFFGMFAVTLVTAALSLRQNAELIAAFALVGGFLTPVLVSTHQNHEIALFSYIALLDLGTLWIVAVKRWHRLLYGSYAGTAMLAFAWASAYYTESQVIPTFLFATVFFLIFVVAPFFSTGDDIAQSTRTLTTGLILLNAGGYFTATYLMLIGRYRLLLAGLCVLTAELLLVLARMLRKRQAREYSSVHIAAAVGFISVAVPIQLAGHWIAFGWLVEASAIIWASHRSSGRLLRYLGAATLALGILQVLTVDSETQQRLVFNPRFGLYLLAIAALGLLAYYSWKEGGEDNRNWVGGAILALNLLALVALHFEVVDYFRPPQHTSMAELRSLEIARDFTYSAIWMLYASGLMLVGFWKRSAFLRWQAILLFALTAAKVFFVDISTLERGYRIAAFIVLGILLLAVSFFYQRSRVKTAQ